MFAPPGGETLIDVQRRALAALERIASQHPGQTVLIATHGGTIRSIVCQLDGRGLRDYWNIEMGNCGITIVEASGCQLTLTTINDCSHLGTAE